ncbi:Alpha/Beta hydrolase protein [Mycena albidolilacea]|uniref:Carboxylic ester hydrolase n=1 Tax=Mycena albidolilacea TaxID=1033008 RepID=A0AAD6ZWC1_9AGAR|nr:Alpha/Beta hydrolase protein [Mycena albidolilacea]
MRAGGEGGAVGHRQQEREKEKGQEEGLHIVGRRSYFAGPTSIPCFRHTDWVACVRWLGMRGLFLDFLLCIMGTGGDGSEGGKRRESSRAHQQKREEPRCWGQCDLGLAGRAGGDTGTAGAVDKRGTGRERDDGFMAAMSVFGVGNSRDTDVSPVIERSVQTGEPFIVVVLNYRLSAFGFPAAKELLYARKCQPTHNPPSEIFALEWVQKYISAFGGDPNRVVIGGQSAGAISTALLLLSNNQNSNALFRGVFMESGSSIGSPSPAVIRSHYDALVAANNCCASKETLSCLRRVPFDSFVATVNRTTDIFSYQSSALVWQPYVDSDVIVCDPLVLVAEGLYAKISLMTGDSDDEGTYVGPLLTQDD